MDSNNLGGSIVFATLMAAWMCRYEAHGALQRQPPKPIYRRSLLAEGVGFISSLENIEEFRTQWQTSMRIVSLYCLSFWSQWQTALSGSGRREFDSQSVLRTQGEQSRAIVLAQNAPP